MPDGHVIAEVSYRDERIRCVCGAVVTASVDVERRERHGPLDVAWADHRRANGCRILTVTQVLAFRRSDPAAPWSSWRAKGLASKARSGRADG